MRTTKLGSFNPVDTMQHEWRPTEARSGRFPAPIPAYLAFQRRGLSSSIGVGALALLGFGPLSLDGQEQMELTRYCFFESAVAVSEIAIDESEQSALDAVDRVLGPLGLQPNFDLRMSPDVVDAGAAFRSSSRVVLYSEELVERILGSMEMDWDAAGILAHAMGHHLMGHQLTGNRLGIELEADRYAGFMLQRMGSTAEQAAAVADHLPVDASPTHPGRVARRDAIVAGWEEALRLESVQVSKAPLGNQPMRQPVVQILESNVEVGAKTSPTGYSMRAVFEGDPTRYLVRPDATVIAIPPGGKAIWAGRKLPPRNSSAAWTFWTPYGEYDVLSNGSIVTSTAYGEPRVRGYVTSIRTGVPNTITGASSRGAVVAKPIQRIPAAKSRMSRAGGGDAEPADLGTNWGTLTGSDFTYEDGRFFDAWVYRVSAPAELVITLISDDFDAYLVVAEREGGGLHVLAENDDGGNGSNSTLNVRFPDDGFYVILATTYSGGETGNYELILDRPEAIALPAIAVGSIVRSDLASTNDTRPNGTSYRAWNYEGLAGETVTVDMLADDFDTYLLMGQGRMGFGFVTLGRDDDGGDDTNSRLSVTLPEGGIYSVVASSYDISEGDFTLMIESDSRRGPVDAVDPPRGRRIQLGHYCTFDGTVIETDAIYGFQSDNAAREALNRVVGATGLQPNFHIFAGNVPNAAAVIQGDTRLIVYNQPWMEQLGNATGSDWARLAVLAHEVGHHLQNHTLEGGGSRPERELEADEYAGFTLQRMGATLEQTVQLTQIFPDEGSRTHPGRSARESAFANGWMKSRDMATNPGGNDRTSGPERVREPSPPPPPPPDRRTTTPRRTPQVELVAGFGGDPVEYYVMEDNAIVAVFPDQSSAAIGRRTPPTHPMFAWTWSTPRVRYGVMRDGTIVTQDAYGNLVPIGQVWRP